MRVNGASPNKILGFFPSHTLNSKHIITLVVEPLSFTNFWGLGPPTQIFIGGQDQKHSWF